MSKFGLRRAANVQSPLWPQGGERQSGQMIVCFTTTPQVGRTSYYCINLWVNTLHSSFDTKHYPICDEYRSVFLPFLFPFTSGEHKNKKQE